MNERELIQPIAATLSAEALRCLPEAETIVMDGGQTIPLRSSGSRTTTTARHARIRGLAYDAGRAERFEVGMDINPLIKELHQNTLRHLCIADVDRSRLFSDPEVRILAAALADNTSVITLRIPGCYATDVSLIPLYTALKKHPAIRSLDVSDTKGSDASGRALVDLVCKNTSIVHVEHANVRMSDKDTALLQEALRYNGFNCRDPGKNPYDASLIKYIDETGKNDRAFKESMAMQNPWMIDPESGEVQLHVLENLAKFYAPAQKSEGEEEGDVADGPDDDAKTQRRRRKKKAVTFGAAELEVHRQVCDDYMNGQCRYGSRCKYLHPEKSRTLTNRIIRVKAQEEEERAEEEEYRTNNDDRTTVLSRASTKRLRGRTTSNFKFDRKKIHVAIPEVALVDIPNSVTPKRKLDSQAWIILGSSIVIAATIVVGLRAL